MYRRYSQLFFTGLLLMLVSTQLLADPIYFIEDAVLPDELGTLQSEREKWKMQITDLEQEGFEGLISAAPSLEFNHFTLNGVNLISSFSQAPGAPIISTEGSFILSFNTSGNTSVSFDFFEPINAFAIDITSIDWLTPSISFFDDIGNEYLNFNTYIGRGSATFFGVFNDQPFSNVTFSFLGSEILSFDNLQYSLSSSNIPEPSTVTCMLISLIGIAFFKKEYNLS